MKNILGGLIFVLAFLFLPAVALAVDEIDVEYPVGTNINGNDIFNEDNILPGWEDSKTIRVRNKSTTDDTNLYFKFDVNGDKKLAGKLKLYVIRVADNNYRIGGLGDRWDLKEADEKKLYVDKLSATEGERYKIKIKFDEDAGNEYQGLETDFDIDFTIESEDAGSGTEGEILASEGRIVSGEPPAEEALEEEAGVVGGEEVAGAEEALCESWPLWVWIVLLILYAALFNFSSFREIKEANKIRWFWQAVYTIAALVIWYFFDKCRMYQWFPLVVVIIGMVSYWYYLHILRNSVRQNNPEIEDTNRQQ